MTVPNTPAGSTPGPDPFAPPHFPPQPPVRAPRRPLGPELGIGALITVAGAVLGVLLGYLWLWLAPRIGFQVQGNRILYLDPEGEEGIAADAVFALLGLGFGILTALVSFLLTRARGGGIAVAVGLVLGGLAGSVIGWQLGIRLGPTSDLRAHALAVGDGGRFDGPLQLSAHGALLVWPMAATVLLLALSAAFGKREPDLPPYWATTLPPLPPPAGEKPAGE
ncbi:DUF2567 domain-containing protein [Kitasatospora sp. NPDC049285]|uniref:DUF2567 domain-containing protein n=1 Tax=Kitasatospora sp. NPDC049285 TaxID=3157096 RepID=UPI003445FCA4